MIEEMIIFISLGVFSGLIAGLFGIGGGTLIVPVLVACFISMGFEESIIVHLNSMWKSGGKRSSKQK